MDFEKVVKSLIKQRGFKIGVFSKELQYTRQGFDDMLKRGIPKDDLLEKICKKLQVDKSYFLDDKNLQEPAAKYSIRNSNQLDNLQAQLDAKDLLIDALREQIKTKDELIDIYRASLDIKTLISDVKNLKELTLMREKT